MVGCLYFGLIVHNYSYISLTPSLSEVRSRTCHVISNLWSSFHVLIKLTNQCRSTNGVNLYKTCQPTDIDRLRQTLTDSGTIGNVFYLRLQSKVKQVHDSIQHQVLEDEWIKLHQLLEPTTEYIYPWPIKSLTLCS